MNTELIIAWIFALVIAGAIAGFLWIRRHPDVD